MLTSSKMHVLRFFFTILWGKYYQVRNWSGVFPIPLNQMSLCIFTCPIFDDVIKCDLMVTLRHKRLTKVFKLTNICAKLYHSILRQRVSIAFWFLRVPNLGRPNWGTHLETPNHTGFPVYCDRIRFFLPELFYGHDKWIVKDA